jgi:hypothetical protein
MRINVMMSGDNHDHVDVTAALIGQQTGLG